MRTGGDNGNDTVRGDENGALWSRMYVDTELPWNVNFRVGRFGVDFEGDKGLVNDYTSLFGDFPHRRIPFAKSFGTVDERLLQAENCQRRQRRC